MATSAGPFDLSARELAALLKPAAPLHPELEAARSQVAALREAPQTRHVLAQTEQLMDGIAQIPRTPYTVYRLYARNGDRGMHEAPYFLKRTALAAAALRLFLGEPVEGVDLLGPPAARRAYGSVAAQASMGRDGPGPMAGYGLKDIVQDYVWDICEESNWVLPAHENRSIDLFSAETGFVLAETLALLGDALDAEVRHRVREEIERRIFDPYLRYHKSLNWYEGHNNWNGVCNSSVAATFLILEPEVGRVARALEIALAGLRVFLATAFEEDGSSTEGVAYWHYGLINFVALAEMLRAKTAGAIDLLDSDHMRRVAAYPAKMLLTGSWFASFSDCPETVRFNPGIVAKLAERTGEESLLNLLAHAERIEGDWRLTMMIRNMLWWDGKRPQPTVVEDAVLPRGGVARLTGRTAAGDGYILAIKAGHNAENHNQNDIGSFLIHVDGENLLTDPGRGLYNRAYFGPQRYENIFANSYGHSVPRIGGALQAPGAEFRGELLDVELDGEKSAAIDFGGAYEAGGLRRATRRVRLGANGGEGTIWLQDEFEFSGRPAEVEEALVTWLDVEVEGSRAVVHGKNHDLRLSIEEPEGANFAVEKLEEACRANACEGVLKRLTFTLPVSEAPRTRVRMEITPTGRSQ